MWGEVGWTTEQFIDGGTLSQAGESRLEASLGCNLMGERGAGSGVQTWSPNPTQAVRRQVCPGKNMPAWGKRFLPSFISAALFLQASHCLRQRQVRLQCSRSLKRVLARTAHR